MSSPAYRLVRPSGSGSPARPALDADQRRVVEHPGGPLLVLAGPGTGKTTTLVEAIADRVENRGTPAEAVLALTFGRKAAEQLRDRVAARLSSTTTPVLCTTFHSFGYGLVRAYAPAELYAEPLRLLTAPEQDVVLRQLLTDAPESVRWPDGFRAALRTRGFVEEVHRLVSRARERGLDPAGLRGLGERQGRPEWVAAGWFLDQYLEVLDSQGALDYTDVIARAVVVAEDNLAELRARYRCVFVDEYQDTDPAQVALVRALAGDGRDLVAVGDPDQSIYGFRGAEVRGILDFPDRFRGPDGSPAEVIALGTTRRFGTRIAAATRRIAAALPVAGSIGAEALRSFRSAAPALGVPEGRVEVCTYDTARAEAEHLADRLRRAHLVDGVPWSRIAVLVRSGRHQIPPLKRALLAAGVPVEVAADEIPLAQDTAVRPLLVALGYLRSSRSVTSAGRTPEEAATAAELAEAVLTSPLCGLDAVELRALTRALRRFERDRLGDGGRPRPATQLLVEALDDPAVAARILEVSTGSEGPGARFLAVAELLARVRRAVEAGSSPHEVLWLLWSGTNWPERVRRSAEGGGPAARMAHRDLDALCALFDLAERAEEHRGRLGVDTFLDTLVLQQIPADSLAETGVRGEGVRLLTAHRAKGLEWDVVAVASVQEEVWPDLRRRSSLLGADRLGGEGVVEPPPVSAMLAEERRLFYVACTRARRRLLVGAVASSDPDGDQPSRFLEELGVEVEHVQGRPRRPLSLAGLVADLRHTVTDPATEPALRVAAADRLVRLAALDSGGRPLVPAADPAQWWGTRAESRAAAALRPAEQPVRLSASDLSAVEECPLHWFLEREAGGSVPASGAQGFGLVVHELADRVARGELSADDGVEALLAQVEPVWERLRFRTPWAALQEHRALRLALERFLRWHGADRGRRLVATEQAFATTVTLPAGERILLRGFVDRLELDAEGRLVVVDLKTGKYAPSGPAVRDHVQLGVYQYAADHGAFAGLEEVGDAACAGAELVQLRAGSGDAATVQGQAPEDPGRSGIEDRLAAAAAMLRTEEFEARPGEHCRRCAFVAVCPAAGPGTVFDR